MGNPAGDFCCRAGDECPDAAAPSCGGALEDEACAADLAAGLGVSQPCCPREDGSQGKPLSGSPSLPVIHPKAVGPPLYCCEKRMCVIFLVVSCSAWHFTFHFLAGL